jgi:ELWxxDGT repeat protein
MCLIPAAGNAQVQATLVSDVRPGAASSAPWRVGAIGDTLLFMADGDGALGPEVWATDGREAWLVLTPADTSIGQPRLLGRIGPDAYLMVGGVIWRTDGVDADTVRVGVTSSRDFSSCGGRVPSVSLPSRVVFSAGQGCAVWAVNRDSSWVVMDPFVEGGAGMALTQFIIARGNDAYVFRAFDGVAGRRVYRTTGTPGDFNPVLDPEPDVSPRLWNTVALYNGSFYYDSDRGTTGEELWRWDASGTPTLVGDVAPGSASSTPRGAFVALGHLFFLASNSTTGRELRMYDGSSLTTPFEIAAGSGPPASVTQVGHREVAGALYFWLRSGLDGNDRFALHTWDGTTLRSVSTGLSTSDFHEAGHIVAAGDRVWFDGCDLAGVHGASLWQTDGVTAAIAIAGSSDACTGARPFMAMAEADDALLARVQDPAVGIEPFLVRPTGAVAVDPGVRPASAALHVTPNPIAERGSVIVVLPMAGNVRVEIFDMLGRRVASISGGRLEAGRHALALPALRPGAYIVRAGEQRAIVTVSG